MNQDAPSQALSSPGDKLGDDLSPAQNVPTTNDHAAGAPEADSSEPQIPRLGEGGAQPGAHDPSQATAGSPVLSAGIADQAGADQAGSDPEARAIAEERPEDATGARGTVGAGRAVDAAFARSRQPHQQQQAQAGGATGLGTGQEAKEGARLQQRDFQGAGYPTADLDGRVDDVTTDMDPEASAVAPPMAPAEHGPAEDEPEDTSIIGQGHADKAAWNRERTKAPQPGYDAVASAPGGRTPGSTPGSSEDMGYPGGAPDEDAPGLDTGDGRLDELAEDEDVDEDENLEDATDALDDDTNADQGLGGQRMSAKGQPRLPEDATQPDEGRSPEDLLIADENEDAMFAQGELGDTEDLEMEELNETDDIAADFEDQRPDMDDGASGNERSTM